jgi:hypothetical protein
MNIWRGFRRLSVLAGVIGLLALCGQLGSTQPTANQNPLDPLAPIPLTFATLFIAPLSVWILMLVIYVGAPVALTLLAGWVVAGFSKSD